MKACSGKVKAAPTPTGGASGVTPASTPTVRLLTVQDETHATLVQVYTADPDGMVLLRRLSAVLAKGDCAVRLTELLDGREHLEELASAGSL